MPDDQEPVKYMFKIPREAHDKSPW
jgi:hypothetical protein